MYALFLAGFHKCPGEYLCLENNYLWLWYASLHQRQNPQLNTPIGFSIMNVDMHFSTDADMFLLLE